MKLTSNYPGLFKQIVEETYHNIRNFEVRHCPVNMQRIEYHDGWHEKTEYPSMFCWDVYKDDGSHMSWKFAPRPRIRREMQRSSCWLFSDRMGDVLDYGPGMEELQEVIKLSAQGLTSDEVNRKMRFSPPSRWL
jgi:hypothetical protein